MKHKQKVVAIIAIILAMSIVSAIQVIGTKMTTVTYVSTIKLSHRQELWKSSLEYCESRGDPNAINEEDLDGTPSYGSFQFKPSTLDYFADKYGIATTTVMDYEVQNAVVIQMILHRDEIRWDRQFPWCVKKLGSPPSL